MFADTVIVKSSVTGCVDCPGPPSPLLRAKEISTRERYS